MIFLAVEFLSLLTLSSEARPSSVGRGRWQRWRGRRHLGAYVSLCFFMQRSNPFKFLLRSPGVSHLAVQPREPVMRFGLLRTQFLRAQQRRQRLLVLFLLHQDGSQIRSEEHTSELQSQSNLVC